MLVDYLLVDGYNVVNAWEELRTTAQSHLELARIDLIEELAKFKGVLWSEIIIVFDAHQTKGGKRHSERINGILVLYTREKETADSLIEELVYGLVDRGVVEVATSDWQEQRLILGKGATRISARELQALLEEAKHRLRKEYLEKNSSSKNPLINYLDDKDREKLNKIRRQD